MHFYLLSLLLVSFYLYRSLQQPPLVASRLKVRHCIVTAAVAVLTSEDTYTVFFAVTHPQAATAVFYVAKGFAPAWLAFSFKVVSTILGAIIWTGAFGLAMRKPKDRTVFLRVWPFYVIFWLIEYVVIVQAHGIVTSSGYFFGFYILGTAILAFWGFVIYLHFHSTSSDDLFLSNKAA